METQHTISELTTNNQMSDVQFLFNKYEELQIKLKEKEQELEDKEKEIIFLKNKLNDIRYTTIQVYDDVRNAKAFLTPFINGSKKVTKADIIERIKSTLETLNNIRKNLEETKFV